MRNQGKVNLAILVIFLKEKSSSFPFGFKNWAFPYLRVIHQENEEKEKINKKIKLQNFIESF